jgi:hypothetical protein
MVAPVTVEARVTLSDRWQFNFLSHFDYLVSVLTGLSSFSASSISTKVVTIPRFYFFVLLSVLAASFASLLAREGVPVKSRVILRLSVQELGDFRVIN